MAGNATLAVLLLVGSLLVNTKVSAFTCHTEGRFPLPDDCGKFVDCFLGPDGVMMSSERDCFGYPFSPDKKRCVGHEEMPDCEPQSYDKTRQFHFPDLDYHCVDPSREGTCHHCYAGITCLDGKAFLNMCESFEDACDIQTFVGRCIAKPVIGTPFNANCYCEGVYKYGDVYNLTYHHFCDINSRIRETTECPRGEQYNPNVDKCEGANSFPIPECNGASPTKPNPNNCQHYYTCFNDGSVLAGSCSSSQYYDDEEKKCVRDCEVKNKWENPSSVCKSGDTYVADPHDCTKYYMCDNLTNPTHLQCPGGYLYSHSVKKCVSGTIPADCLKFDYRECPGYEQVDPCPDSNRSI